MRLLITLFLLTFSFLEALPCGLYFSAIGGGNWMNVEKIEDVKLNVDHGWMLGGALGVSIMSGTRAELEVSYRQNDLDYIKSNGIRFGVGGNANTTAIMANLYQNFDLGPIPVTPYLGLGAGYAVIKDKIHAANARFKGTGKGFAWQSITGFNFPFFCGTELGIEYRYFQARDKTKDHTACVVVRCGI